MGNTGWTPVAGTPPQPAPQAPNGWTPVQGQSASPPDAPRTWEDSVSDFGKALWQQVNPVSGIKGAYQIATHPITAIENDADARKQIYNEAEKAFKAGRPAEGAAHLLYAALPVLGPNMDAAANDFLQGKIAKGLGSSVGQGIAIAGPGALKDAAVTIPGADAAKGIAERMYQSALKPSRTMGAAKIESAVNTGLEQQIPVSAPGAEKLGDLIDDLNDKIKAQIASGPTNTVNKFAVTSRLRDTAKAFSTQVNPESDLSAVSESGNEFLRNQPNQIPAADAQALKQGTYKQLKNRAYGELGTATVESQKALARGIKEELVNQFPEIGDLNAQESKAINLDGALQSAVQRIGNHQLIGIGTPIVGSAAGVATGSAPAVAVAGALKAIIDNPVIKSKLAIQLWKAGRGKVTLNMAKARVAGYVSALGNAATSPSPVGQNNSQ